MAIVRTVLSPTNLIQPQHGSLGYESDMDTNMTILNTLIPQNGTPILDLGLNGVYSGFTLSTSGTLIPGLTTGVLYAQGTRYNASSPSPGAAPASATNYLFYNSSSGFYYQTSAIGATSGDALVGKVTTSGTAVTAVTQATKVYGQVALTPGAPNNFTVAHLLGRIPLGVLIQMTTFDMIVFQSGTMYDATNLYLSASSSTAAGKALVW